MSNMQQQCYVTKFISEISKLYHFLGSFHSAAQNSLPIWHKTAKVVFNHTMEDEFVRKRGVYDKSIIDCAFRENLKRRKEPSYLGGCPDFQPSLTTNGLCYTFNGKHSSELWKDSKMMTAFVNNFPSETKNKKNFGYFGGARTTQGIKIILRKKN